VDCILNHNADDPPRQPRELADYELCLELHITPSELRSMPAKDVAIIQAVRTGKALAQSDDYRWELCKKRRGGGEPQCPPELDYLSEVCQACIKRKAKSQKAADAKRT